MCFLSRPDIKYKKSYLLGLKELEPEGWHFVEPLDFIHNNFETYIKRLIGFSSGINLPEGQPTYHHFWLIDKENFIGSINIRHLNENLETNTRGHIGYVIIPSKRKKGYGKKILSLAIPEAKKLNYDKMLITCNSDNIASKKIIEDNGGEFINTLPFGTTTKLRYWIRIN